MGGLLPDVRDGAPIMLELHAAATSGNVERIKAVLNTGVEVDQLDSRERTALFGAAKAGHPHAIRALVAAGANVNHRDKKGWTPVMLAAFSRRTEAIQALLGLGADEADLSRADGERAKLQRADLSQAVGERAKRPRTALGRAEEERAKRQGADRAKKEGLQLRPAAGSGKMDSNRINRSSPCTDLLSELLSQKTPS